LRLPFCVFHSQKGIFMTTAQSSTVTAIGVGIDTSRYGHHVSFLRDDLQPATEPMAITENRE
jgi:hypothetical protein